MSQKRIIAGLLIILVGLSFIVEVPILQFGFALLVIWIGIKVLTGKEKNSLISETKTSENTLTRVLIFSGINQKMFSENFKGGELVTIFGSSKIDLSEVKTKRKDPKLELVTVFGEIMIILPPNWKVKSEGVGILGTFDNQTKQTTQKGPQIDIEGASIFGSVKIITKD